MAKRQRKTLVVCRRCHEDIHAGRATAHHPDVITGEPGAVKARPPGSGRGRRKRTRTTGTSPAAYFTLLVRTYKQLGQGEAARVVEEHAVDTGLSKSLLDLERQAAQELGQWTKRKQAEYCDRIVITSIQSVEPKPRGDADAA